MYNYITCIYFVFPEFIASEQKAECIEKPTKSPRLTPSMIKIAFTQTVFTERLFASTAWHNVIYENVYKVIDESVILPLHSNTIGIPNVSIAILVSMSAIKDRLNLIDKILIDQFRYHAQLRMAIGIQNLNDKIPLETAYYDFRRKLTNYEVSNKESRIMKICFWHPTRKQAIKLNVSHKQTRMDSKLIGSQTSWDSRCVLIQKTLYTFWRALSSSDNEKARRENRDYLSTILKEKADHITYIETPVELYRRNNLEATMLSYAWGSLEKQDMLSWFAEYFNLELVINIKRIVGYLCPILLEIG
jgi:hypothetical protein